MKPSNSTTKSLIGAAVAAALLAACATTPREPDGAAALRARLTQLQSDPQLATRAPLAMQQANLAVTAAEQPQGDPEVNAHLQFIADRRISIAEAAAHNQWSLDQRPVIAQQRAAMQLRARTAEADAAHQQANAAQGQAIAAQNEAVTARVDADTQRRDADAARIAGDEAQRKAADLQQQLADLQARNTDQGLVVTLGGVLFTTGTSDLNAGGITYVAKLADFLKRHEERNARVVGYTDSTGSSEHNQSLSERRADAVKTYLVNQGVSSNRLTASGQGESSPIGDNSSVAGRAQNRRVEVTIDNEVISAR
jgi:outer membrane protein OmpA-like peptidoglycan-associated protein